jgi:hypothetical protein
MHSSIGKRKPATGAKTSNNKGKGEDPATVIEEFYTAYGKNMFDEDGIYQLTQADSARCGVLIQKQKWFLDKAVSMGLQPPENLPVVTCFRRRFAEGRG